MPVPIPASQTVAPDSAAPVGSVTAPAMALVVSPCEYAWGENKKPIAAIAAKPEATHLMRLSLTHNIMYRSYIYINYS
jgi:hypothetical protein